MQIRGSSAIGDEGGIHYEHGVSARWKLLLPVAKTPKCGDNVVDIGIQKCETWDVGYIPNLSSFKTACGAD